MVHEITITVYNPTTKTDKWTADVYLKSFDSEDRSEATDKRIYCGTATVVEEHGPRGQTKAESLAEACKFLAGFEIPEDTGK